jgi:hypothetical protein
MLRLVRAVLVVARVSRLPFDFFVKRVWLGIPLFAGIVIIPSLFMVPGARLFDFGVGPIHLGISAAGVWGAISEPVSRRPPGGDHLAEAWPATARSRRGRRSPRSR